MTWVALVRVSTDDQETTRQRKAIRKACRDEDFLRKYDLPNPIEIPPDLWFQDYESRDQWEKRPDFCRLIKLAEKGRLRGIIIEKFDRFGVQDDQEFGFFLYQFRSWGVRLISTVDGDLTAPGLDTKILNLFRSRESEQYQIDLGRKVVDGKAVKVEQKEHPWEGGIAPFGFDKVVMDSQGRILYKVQYLHLKHCIQITPCPHCLNANQFRLRCPDCNRVERLGAEVRYDLCPACRERGRRQRGCKACKKDVIRPNDMPKKAKKEDATLVFSEDTSRVEIVRAIYTYFRTHNAGFFTTAHWANAHGFRFYARKFTHQAVMDILTNPAYAGGFGYYKTTKARFSRFEEGKANPLPLPPGGKRTAKMKKRPRKDWLIRWDCWDGIVDRDEYDEVRAKVEARKTGTRPPKSAEFWLQPFLVCGNCGGAMYGRHGANPRDRHKIFYRCSTYALAVCRKETDTCKCGNNQVHGDEVEAAVLDHLRKLKVDLSRSDDREAILRLYSFKHEREDILAQTLRNGVAFYAEELRRAFDLGNNPTCKLAQLLNQLFSVAFPVEQTTDCLADAMRTVVEGRSARVSWFGETISEEKVVGLLKAIEETKTSMAQQMLDQLQGEYDTLTRAKALARSDRERQSLDRQLRQMEERQVELEEHLTPLPERRKELVREISQFEARIIEAERAFAEGDNLAKSEALRRALGQRGRIVLHFQHRVRETPDKRSKSGKFRQRSVWLKDKIEFRHGVQAGEGTDMQREQALALLREYVTDPSLIRHGLAVEAAIRAYARKLGQDEEKWGVVGLLHDFDYERWPNPPEHPLQGSEILRQRGYPDDVIYAILSHADYLTDYPRVHLMDKALYACDELAGLITAAALVRPNGILDLKAASVKKKMKSKGFARNVNREDIARGAADFGVDLTEHIQFVIDAMKERAVELELTKGAAGEEES